MIFFLGHWDKIGANMHYPVSVDDDQGLKNVQWVYLGVAGFVGLLIVLFLFVPFPEITGIHTSEYESH
jgi:FHS family L-fucose permease-like MFS transporter